MLDERNCRTLDENSVRFGVIAGKVRLKSWRDRLEVAMAAAVLRTTFWMLWNALTFGQCRVVSLSTG